MKGKLSADDVHAIWKRYLTTDDSYTTIARDYGVSDIAIAKILTGRSYRRFIPKGHFLEAENLTCGAMDHIKNCLLVTVDRLAREHGVSVEAIYQIAFHTHRNHQRRRVS